MKNYIERSVITGDIAKPISYWVILAAAETLSRRRHYHYIVTFFHTEELLYPNLRSSLFASYYTVIVDQYGSSKYRT